MSNDSALAARLHQSLRRSGFDLEHAKRPEEVLPLIYRSPYQLILVDVGSLPGTLTRYLERLHAAGPACGLVVLGKEVNLQLSGYPELQAAVMSVLPPACDDEELLLVVRRSLRLQHERGSALPSIHKLQVLLIEDDAQEADALSEYLWHEQGVDYEIQQVARLSRGLELLHDQTFQVVVVDLALPDASGLDAVTRIHCAAPNAALIAISAVSDPLLARHALQAGAQDFLVKGQFSSEALRQATRFARERKRTAHRYAYRSQFDQLTGLITRTSFRGHLRRGLLRAQRKGSSVAVLLLDIDKFGAVNEAYGHGVGDSLLREVSRRLQAVIREYDTAARLRSDKFAVLLEDLQDPCEPELVAQRVLQQFESPFQIGDHALELSASMGLAAYPVAEESADGLLRAADRALCEAKRESAVSIRVYQNEQTQTLHPREQLQSELTVALERGEFTLFYQPQVDLKTRRVTGVEALLRWQKSDGSLLAPAEFIPLLEEMGLFGEVGWWVMHHACQQLKMWRDTEAPELRMAVNLSASQFAEGGLVDAVEQALRKSDLPPQALDIEIQENVLVQDAEKTMQSLSKLKSLGVRLSIDDFGSASTSHQLLQRFSVDAIKVDSSLVRNLSQDEQGKTAVAAAVSLGHRLGLDVVAEGVETQEQLAFLSEDGCDAVQGFLTGIPAAEWCPSRVWDFTAH